MCALDDDEESTDEEFVDEEKVEIQDQIRAICLHLWTSACFGSADDFDYYVSFTEFINVWCEYYPECKCLHTEEFEYLESKVDEMVELLEAMNQQ
jgi:hypothetical protein